VTVVGLIQLEDITEEKFRVVLVTRSQSNAHGDKLVLTIKGSFLNREDAQVKFDKLKAHAKACHQSPDYRLVDMEGYRDLLKEVTKDQARRAAEGKVRAAKTRERNAKAGKKRAAPMRVMCPKCKCSSKVLYSEMGGLQTRQCKNGHKFTFDKWIADRAFWNPTAAIPNIFGAAR
jgi:hypothetical protein